MPPRKRTTTPADDAAVETAVEAVAPAEAPAAEQLPEVAVELPCGECFPLGWPATATAVGCEHGSWVRAAN